MRKYLWILLGCVFLTTVVWATPSPACLTKCENKRKACRENAQQNYTGEQLSTQLQLCEDAHDQCEDDCINEP